MSNTVKNTTPTSTITRDIRDLDGKTGNLYESIVVIAKRANQISSSLKEELNNKLSEFATSNDNLEEVFENREQIEISKYYERMPKFNNLEEYRSHRERVDVTPIDQLEAMRLLESQERNTEKESQALAYKYAREAEKAKEKQSMFWSALKQLTG